MARAGENDSVDRRILDIAIDHVRRFGLRKTTIVGIAEDAGMSHANIYRYFASKQALGDQVVGEWLRGVEQQLAEIAQAPDPADDKLERFVTFLARSYEHKCLQDAAVFDVFSQAHEMGRELAQRHRQRVRDLLGRVIEEGITTWVFPGADPKKAEALVLDVMFRFLDPLAVRSALKQAGGHATAEARRDRVTRLLLRGLVSGRERE